MIKDVIHDKSKEIEGKHLSGRTMTSGIREMASEAKGTTHDMFHSARFFFIVFDESTVITISPDISISHGSGLKAS